MVAEGQTAIAGETVLADLKAAEAGRTYRELSKAEQAKLTPRSVALHGARSRKGLYSRSWPCISRGLTGPDCRS